MRAALVALAMVTATMANATTTCPTLSEARAAWPGVHLYWFRDNERRRCWSNRRGHLPKLAASVRQPVPRNRVDVPAPPLPSHDLTEPVAVILAERAAFAEATEPPEPEIVFSTFDGAPPDEWPLDERPPSLARIWMLAATFAAMVASVVGVARGFWR